MLLAAPLPATAARSPFIVLDYDADRTLMAVDAQQPWYPASLTKLMTVYLTFEEIAAGRLDPATKLTTSEHAAQQGGTRLGLTKGATLSVMDALLATVTRSANDAAVVLAERIADSEAAFAERMTERAQRLGMTATVFANATGLPDPKQWTTAADMAILARALIHDFADRYSLFATRHMTWQGHQLPNINGLLGSFPGADGLKTGFTCGAGYNIVASAESGGRRLIAVVLGAVSLDARRSEVTRLLQAGFTGKLPKDLVATDALGSLLGSASAGHAPIIEPVMPKDDPPTDAPGPRVRAKSEVRPSTRLVLPWDVVPTDSPRGPAVRALSDVHPMKDLGAPETPGPAVRALSDVRPAVRTASEVHPPIIKPVLPSGCDTDAAHASAGPLQGWALTVGNAHLERDARAMLSAAKTALGGDLQGGRPVIVQRHVARLPPYRAMIVGYDEARAIATCMTLRRHHAYCIVVNPEQLQSHDAIWN